ncbi:MAG: hypothetical protein JW808_11600 [Victivallales bacterium]|nr:hypothetical protein [Victivallales bacterium]
MASPAARMAWLAQTIPTLSGSGIVYTLTQRDAERVAEWLRINKIAAEAYHADVNGVEEEGPSRREDLEQKLLRNELKALVATVALGMGFDKPDLGFVIHFQRPGSVVHYYQQVGRAGRALDQAFGILLHGEEDDQMKMMSEDAKTILLLCGHLGSDGEVDPLNQGEYNTVVRWLLENKLRPADLLAGDHVPDLVRGTCIEGKRLSNLLKRGVKLGFAVGKWNQSGIWVVCRSDHDYPARYRTHLKEKAPPDSVRCRRTISFAGRRTCIGNAMGRNKLIYALAEYGLVVSSDYQKGGTWEGAKEELKRENGRPVFVRNEANVPRGNQELLKMGAMAFPPECLAGNIRDALEKAVGARVVHHELQLEPVVDVPEEAANAPVTKLFETNYDSNSLAEPAMAKEAPSPAIQTVTSAPRSVLEAVKPLILRALDTPKTVQGLAMALEVKKPQAQDWIRMLISEGVLEEQTKRNGKKIAVRKPDEELRLGWSKTDAGP